MVYDIIHNNGKIFIYSIDSILVYNTDNHFLGSIDLYEQESFKYGKFNPTYFNERLWTCDGNMMTVDTNANPDMLYAVTPDLRIIRINTNTYNIVEEIACPDTITHLRPIHGINIIKYDWVHNRLYWLVTGRSNFANCTGNFHVRERYFAIFNIDNNGNLQLYYDEYKNANYDYENRIIFDVEFNLDNDYFYLLKLNEIELLEITNDTNKVNLVDSIKVDTNIYSNYYKFGKMLYVKDDIVGIHKIIALPYRYPSAFTPNPKFYVIDGGDSSDLQIIGAPSKRILDGVFLPGSQDLILSYAPDTSEIIYSIGGSNTDIAIYHYDSITNSFDTVPTDTINTNQSQEISEYDKNGSLKLMTVDANTVLISKKDEIVKLSASSGNYSFSQLLEAEGNFFMKGVSTDYGKSYVINMVANELEIFDNSFNHDSITMGFPVYHITANSNGNKLYFFNKLNAYNTGLYIYDSDYETTININQDGYGDNNIETAIGDCIYNPYKDHFLVSLNADFENEPAKIRVLRSDFNNFHVTDISLVDIYDNNEIAQYPKKMFIAPDEKLYVMANMQCELTQSPKVFIFNANDAVENSYSFIKAYELTMPGFDDPFVYYSAYFCYNPHNQTVYATIHPTEITLPPYHTVPNSMFDFVEPFESNGNTGLVIKFEENQITTHPLIFPSKIICPDVGYQGNNSQYDGKMFIIGERFYVYDYELDTVDPPQGYDKSFNDITYSNEHDQLFGLLDTADNKYCRSDRKIQIYEIDYENNEISFDTIAEIDGQATSIFSNPYDGNIYIHRKFDDHKLGGTEVSLFYFDPDDQNIQINAIELGITSFYPELDHNLDYWYHFYNITTPYINPYDNSMYVPNGGHSCVSKVEYEPVDSLAMDSGWTWLSFPRLDRTEGPPTPDEVLAQNMFSNGYDSLYMEHLEVDEQNEEMTWVTWGEEQQWQTYELNFVFSEKGYKLYLHEEQVRKLNLEGTILDPETEITIYPNYENWVGYFIPYPQDAFDALEEILDSLTLIKHQDWACKKFIIQTDDGPDTIWRCHGSGTRILEYGDMVILKSWSQLNFTWIETGNQKPHESSSEPEYFTYEEKANYVPIFIELDTSANPAEIGAFSGDTCIGACTVIENDSLVMIRTYTEGITGGEITFENYYGSNKSAPLRIKQYYVLNPQTLLKEKRTIRTNEKQDAFLISFKKDNPIIMPKREIRLICRPNPFKDYCRIEYYLPEDSRIKIQVFDIYGKEIEILQEGSSLNGKHSLIWNAGILPGGIYIIKLTACNQQVNRKVIIFNK